MSVADYAWRIRSDILETPHVVSHSLGYEDRPPVAGIVKGSVAFADGAVLHFKEYLQLSPNIIRLKYAYHYVTATAVSSFDTTTRATLLRGTYLRIHTTGTVMGSSEHPPVRRLRKHCAKQPLL